MGKRRAEESTAEAGDVEMDETDVVNVDFDFFDVTDDDFLSVKSLFRQLLSVDNILFNLSELTQLVVDARCGSTVKADDEEYNDAMALISLVPFAVDQGETGKLLQYWIERTTESGSANLNRQLRKIGASKSAKVGLVVSERLLNMPYEIVPPLYHLLAEESESKKLEYDYLIVPSRVYSERASAVDAATESKSKRGAGERQETTYPFHVEDSVIDSKAVASGDFAFKTPIEETDSRRTFQEYGIYPWGHVAVIEGKKLKALAEAVAQPPADA